MLHYQRKTKKKKLKNSNKNFPNFSIKNNKKNSCKNDRKNIKNSKKQFLLKLSKKCQVIKKCFFLQNHSN